MAPPIGREGAKSGASSGCFYLIFLGFFVFFGFLGKVLWLRFYVFPVLSLRGSHRFERKFEAVWTQLSLFIHLHLFLSHFGLLSCRDLERWGNETCFFIILLYTLWFFHMLKCIWLMRSFGHRYRCPSCPGPKRPLFTVLWRIPKRRSWPDQWEVPILAPALGQGLPTPSPMLAPAPD